MCIGIPMQVIACSGLQGRCQAHDGEHEIDLSLVGTLQPGQWIMVFLGAAREVISEETAHTTSNALLALTMAMNGETDIDHLFADLVGRDPRLPDHLMKKQHTV